MFTGIIETLGTVVEITGSRLRIETPLGWGSDVVEGESIAVNGTCLTVVGEPGPALEFDVSPETFDRTSLGKLVHGHRVNLERAMRSSSRFGGHIVQGHVDTTGVLLSKGESGEFAVYKFEGPAHYGRYLIDKGSIAVDGVSLTLVEPQDGSFDVWLIPATLSHTNLGAMEPGTVVNLEFDVIAKHVEKLLAYLPSQSSRCA